ncbi:MAG: response regulator [Anaerolineales bacterium]
MAEVKPTLLIVEDDPDVAEMLAAYFNVQGYHVSTTDLGEKAVDICRAELPALVILDIRLPDIDGDVVARKLRTTQRTQEIPIIFLTEKRNRSDRLHGLELGADDYITKPFDVQELRLRVRNSLRRSVQGALTNPVTLLPDGALVDERLRECLGSDGWALLIISLQNLDHFREDYGFIASDDILRAISLMIHNAVRQVGGSDDFVGHLHHQDFVLVTSPAYVAGLEERIRTRLEQSVDYFYPLKDREKGVSQSKRIKVRFGRLFADQGTFDDLADLKIAIQARIRRSHRS